MRFIFHIGLIVAVLAGAVFSAAGQEVEAEVSIGDLRRQARLFDEHVVRMGETAYSIARGYAVSPVMLAEDNPGVDPERIKPGQVLLIRKKERGKTEPEEVARLWEEMVEEARKKSAPEDEKTIGIEDVVITIPDSLIDGGVPSVWGMRKWGEDYVTRKSATPRIALLLPLSGTSANPAGNDFTDFYKGALLGFENLRSRGHSAVVTVWDSGRSVEKVKGIVASQDFVDTDLVIGPVYEDELEPVVEFGDFFGVPVVSPLAPVRKVDSDMLYQMTPDPAAKYDKLKPLLEGDVNIIMVSSGAADDKEFELEIAGVLHGRNYGRFTVGQGNVASLIDWERPNVLGVLAGGEQSVNMALATISSSYSNMSARRGRRADISVIGTSKWERYGSQINKNLFFTLGVKFVTNYYIDRLDRETRLFEARYIEVYGDFPSRSAFRGYDAVTLFGGALYEETLFGGEGEFEYSETSPDAPEGTPLGTSYRFVRVLGGRRNVNSEWTLVSFSSDYNITTQ
jgi:LysM repeat protein